MEALRRQSGGVCGPSGAAGRTGCSAEIALGAHSDSRGEWANRSTEQAVVDELIYQVSVRAPRFDRLHELCDGVNRAMLGLGLRRVYSSPDGYESAGEGAYTKTFRFGRKVDKRFFCATADK